MWDVAIVGAGISGLACAVSLKKARHRVIVIDKSRGVGGRAATRRSVTAQADHGAPTVSEPLGDGSYTGYFAELKKDLLQPWPLAHQAVAYRGQWTFEESQTRQSSPTYAVPAGMTAIAKQLASGLDLYRGQRVTAINIDAEQPYWQIFTESTAGGYPLRFEAKALVLAVPAPQAVELCLPLVEKGMSNQVLEALQLVTFEPCIAVIAGYSNTEPLPWSELYCKGDAIVQRVLWESHKRPTPQENWLVIHSTPAFAAQSFKRPEFGKTDAESLGRQLVEHLGHVYRPWMAKPFNLQVHRWRYAITSGGYPGQPISAGLKRPLWFCGDWCTGSSIQVAFEAGTNAAQRLQAQL
jgi:renalase